MTSFERPRGTRDFDPEEMARRRALEARLRGVFERFGYQEISTPTFEHLELFTAKSGEAIVDQLYAFEDKSERELTLRPELTAPVIRFFLNELKARPRPMRLYYHGNCFRYERPQAGRYREFWQFGCELIGAPGAQGDAEVIALAEACVRAAGVEEHVLGVGHVGLLAQLIDRLEADEETKAATYRLIDKDDEGLHEHLTEIGAPSELVAAIETVASFRQGFALSTDELGDRVDKALAPVRERLAELDLEAEAREQAEEHLTAVTETLVQLGALGVEQATLDLGVARGLDYYSGVVFEIEAPALGAESQIVGGGSYTLAEVFGGQPTPTAGFGLGFDRVLLVSDVEGQGQPARVHVTPIGDGTRERATRLAADLREAGIATTIDLRGRSISKNLDYANSLGIPKVILLGSNELEKGVATVKDMESGEQQEVPFDELAEALSG